jgi:hypothetical protein
MLNKIRGLSSTTSDAGRVNTIWRHGAMTAEHRAGPHEEPW